MAVFTGAAVATSTDAPSLALALAADSNLCCWHKSFNGCVGASLPPVDKCSKCKTVKFHHMCHVMAETKHCERMGENILDNPYESDSLKLCIDCYPHSEDFKRVTVDTSPEIKEGPKTTSSKPNVLLPAVEDQGLSSLWWTDMRKLIKKKLVEADVAAIRDLMNEEEIMPGVFAVCVICRDGEGKSNGLVKFRRPHYEHYWHQHTGGLKHKRNMAHWLNLQERVKKGKGKSKVATSLTSFFAAK